MLEQLKALEQAGCWAEIRQIDVSSLDCLPADQQARAYLSISKAWEETATSSGEYRHAVRYAQHAVTAAVPGALMYTWALGRLAALLADVGEFRGAESAARGYFECRPNHPQAAAMDAYAGFALGRSLSRQGRHQEAVDALRRTASAANGELHERISISLMRVLARAGRIQEAVAARPAQLVHLPDSHLAAANALLLSRMGDWSGAQDAAHLALCDCRAGNWRIYDVIEIAELLLTLKQAAHALGDSAGSAVWQTASAELLSQLAEEVKILLQPSLLVKGGDFAHAATSRGPAGDARCGLRGCVG